MTDLNYIFRQVWTILNLPAAESLRTLLRLRENLTPDIRFWGSNNSKLITLIIITNLNIKTSVTCQLPCVNHLTATQELTANPVQTLEHSLGDLHSTDDGHSNSTVDIFSVYQDLLLRLLVGVTELHLWVGCKGFERNRLHVINMGLHSCRDVGF